MGHLHVKSEVEQGSTFWFDITLPLPIAAEIVRPSFTRNIDVAPPPPAELAKLDELIQTGHILYIQEYSLKLDVSVRGVWQLAS